MCNFIEYRNNYSKTLESLCQYYRDEPAFNNIGAIIDFPDNNNINNNNNSNNNSCQHLQ